MAKRAGVHRVSPEIGPQPVRRSLTGFMPFPLPTAEKHDMAATGPETAIAGDWHEMRRTNEDKRRAVRVLLEDAEWSQWSDR